MEDLYSRQNSENQTRLHHLVELIANGRGTDLVVESLHQEKARLPALFARHVPQARQMLRKLIDGHILCESILEDGRPGYRFAATGTFDRLLTVSKPWAP